jgi:hypothetical protein
MSKKNSLDQYYTRPEVAQYCLSLLTNYLGKTDYTFVEPSAGCGAFLDNSLTWEAYDLEPKHESVVKSDFFDIYDLENKIVVGNPPFGFASSLALKFINHSEKYGATVIAFILPKTFKKVLFQEKVSHNLSVALEVDLPDNSFILNGVVYNVPCVFQIWVRKPREVLKFNKYLEKGNPEDYDFTIRRVGGRAGKVISLDEFTASSSLYVKGDLNLIEKYQDLICKEASYTAGVMSITLDEINYIITNKEKVS